ncbi:MAG: hypothetical protein R3E08_06085 [Thiotrichaceae bacterium]
MEKVYDEPFHLTYLEFNGGRFSIFHDNLLGADGASAYISVMSV